MNDPRPQTQIEAEEMNRNEEIREITQPEGNRDADVASARAYARDGVAGAPGSEVAAPEPAADEDDADEDEDKDPA